jgi:Dynein heavy chain AAA lid domain
LSLNSTLHTDDNTTHIHTIAITLQGHEEVRTFHRELFSKYVTPLLEFKELNCSEPVPIGDFNAVQSLCGLYDAFAADADSGIDKGTSATADGYLGLAEKWFVLACIWSVCAAVDEKVSTASLLLLLLVANVIVITAVTVQSVRCFSLLFSQVPSDYSAAVLTLAACCFDH